MRVGEIATEGQRIAARYLRAIWPIAAKMIDKRRAEPVETVHELTERRAKDKPEKRFTEPARGPRGWLGAIFAHGAACLTYEMAHLKASHDILPSLKARWDHGTNRAVMERVDPDLMTTHFAEWQCPIFDSQSPHFLRFEHGPMDDQFQPAISRTVWGKGHENFWLESYLPHDVREPGAGFTGGEQPANAVSKWIEWMIVRRAETVRLPILGTFPKDLHGRDRLLELGLAELAPYRFSEVVRPAAWGKSATLRKEWGARLLRWYWTAQYAIWCVEMLRIHSPAVYAVPSPKWWSRHCAAWGIGVLPVSTRKTYVTGDKSASGLGKRLATNWKMERWETIARRAMTLSKVPGAPGTLGDQIAPAGAERHAFDIPWQLGSAAPPLWAAQGQFSRRQAGLWIATHDTRCAVTDRFLPAWNAAIGLMTSFSGPAFQAWVTTANAVYTGACEVMRCGAALANGELSEGGDVVFGLAKVAAEVGAAVGADLEIPGDLWAQLKSATPIAGWKGVDSAFVAGQAEYVRAILSAAESDGYTYLDQLCGGLISAQ